MGMQYGTACSPSRSGLPQSIQIAPESLNCALKPVDLDRTSMGRGVCSTGFPDAGVVFGFRSWKGMRGTPARYIGGATKFGYIRLFLAWKTTTP